MTPQQLTEREKYQIEALNTEDLYANKESPDFLNRSPSTICRKLARNRDVIGYRGRLAIKRTDKRRYQAKKREKLVLP